MNGYLVDEMNPHWKKHNHRKIDPEDVLLIKALREEGLYIHEIAEKFELSKSHVYKILRGEAWRGL
jgi:DNA invertase Pin-like site-specific DNA recombinase